MCMGCGNTDHEGNVMYARNSENSLPQDQGGRVYMGRKGYSQAA